jgi:hypothetical protein
MPVPARVAPSDVIRDRIEERRLTIFRSRMQGS